MQNQKKVFKSNVQKKSACLMSEPKTDKTYIILYIQVGIYPTLKTKTLRKFK